MDPAFLKKALLGLTPAIGKRGIPGKRFGGEKANHARRSRGERETKDML